MKQFFEFVVNHWILWSLLVVVLILIIIEEIRGRVLGIPPLSPQDLTLKINRENPVIVDLRDTNAFSKGHIIGSINIPHTKLEDSIERLKKHQEQPLVFVDTNGQTSPTEGAKLHDKGFEKVYFLAGGIHAWQQAGYPLTKD